MNNAYITLLTNENFLPGVVVLYNSLKDTNSIYPCYVLITPEVSAITKSFLEQIGLKLISIDRSEIPPLGWKQQHEEQNIDSESIIAFYTKLKITQLKQFNKIIYMDCDMFVLQNIDELFNKPHMSIALDTYSYVIAYDSNYGHMNGGLIVLEPNKVNYDDLINFAYQSNDLGFGDESVGTQYYNLKERKELGLSMYYNTGISEIKKVHTAFYGFNENNIKVLHYIGRKPGTITSRNGVVSGLNDSTGDVGSKYHLKGIDYYNNILDKLEQKFITHPNLIKIKD